MRRVICLATSVALMVAACGGSESVDTTSAEPTPQTTAASQTTAAPATTAAQVTTVPESTTTTTAASFLETLAPEEVEYLSALCDFVAGTTDFPPDAELNVTVLSILSGERLVPPEMYALVEALGQITTFEDFRETLAPECEKLDFPDS